LKTIKTFSPDVLLTGGTPEPKHRTGAKYGKEAGISRPAARTTGGTGHTKTTPKGVAQVIDMDGSEPLLNKYSTKG
jgi:hypothetical protein